MDIKEIVAVILSPRYTIAHGTAGFFQVSRYWPYLNLTRIDDNLFSQALILQQLETLIPFLSPELKPQIEQRAQTIKQRFGAYQKIAAGEVPIYQFWPIGRNHHFPNGHFLHRFRKFKSPPDLDDTALAYLTLPHPTEDTRKLRGYLRHFANGNRKWNRKAPKFLQIKDVYSTWMGTGRMPIEFDVVVMSNALRLFSKHQLSMNSYDLATLHYIKEVLQQEFFLENPFYAAPWYPNPILIFYHLAKMVEGAMDQTFQPIHQLLQGHLQGLESFVKRPMDNILLVLAAKKLGATINLEKVSLENILDQKAPFYVGGMLTALEQQWVWKIAKYDFFHWQFLSKALDLALYCEYLEILKTKKAVESD